MRLVSRCAGWAQRQRTRKDGSPRVRKNGTTATMDKALIPPMDQLDLQNIETRVLAASASVHGPLKVNRQRRHVLLWRHPDDTAGEFKMLVYESQLQTAPKDIIIITKSLCKVVRNPKGKNYKHCLMLTVESGEYLLIADDDATIERWAHNLKVHSTVADQPDAGDDSDEGDILNLFDHDGDDMTAFVDDAFKAMHTSPEAAYFEGNRQTRGDG